MSTEGDVSNAIEAKVAKDASLKDKDVKINLISDTHTGSHYEERRISGRERKATNIFTPKVDDKEEEEFKPPMGPGTKLRDIEYLNESITRCTKKDMDILSRLYIVMYGRRLTLGNVKQAKEHILDFSGYVPFEDDKQKEKFRDDLAVKLCRGVTGFVHLLMDFLHIDRSKKSFTDKGLQGNKDDCVERIIDWLESPTATSVIARSKKSGKAKPKAKKRAVVKKTTSKKKVVAIEDGEETDDDHEAPKAVKRKVEKAKGEPAAKKKKKGESHKPKQKRMLVKKKKVAVTDEGETESENDDDFEEMARKAEMELKENINNNHVDGTLAGVFEKVKKIMDEGDVEKMTLKSVMETLSNDLKCDVSMHKQAIKDFIANTL